MEKGKVKTGGGGDLAATVEMMLSGNYRERFRAEYIQTKIRYERLKAFNNMIEAATRTREQKNATPMPKHDVPDKLLRAQQKVMGEYLHLLEVRAVIEGVDLNQSLITADVPNQCPVRIGETVVAWLKDDNNVVERIYWDVCGVAYFDGEWWAFDNAGERYKVGSEMCVKRIEEGVCGNTI